MGEMYRARGVFDDEKIALAASNYEAQEWLVRELGKAFQMSRLSVEELASELELEPTEAREWLDGEVDLTLTELRHLANAIDAHVTYRVGALKTLYSDRLREVESDAPWIATAPWGKAEYIDA
ncbi:hypothetical protein ACFPER_12035 [Agromyces aurantiacus]|uniref:XRE family transcriptional regulator n=1 Tax=Agromyces aurantiacus TaxID=165814 RepID=A0ABV9R5W3_9MICO|nr:hypothetical protein [Agromyces aurantiacus]MBM7504210.1 transcriptional regulator with XRE-family HTH domain [Agromyces aurantiacus]